MIRAGWLAARQDGDLPDPRQRRRRGPAARQLGRGDRDAEVTRRATGTGRGELDDFIGAFADWHFDWLDVPALIRGAETILEFPMVDQDPLPWWSQGRVTLLGDAAHPMYPRGSNGAGQAILDARALADALARTTIRCRRSQAYEARAAAGHARRSCA